MGDPMRMKPVSAPFNICPAQATDAQAWLDLWRAYCRELHGEVSDEITEGIWQRIIAPEQTTWCLLPYRNGEAVGFANYILHPHTWSLQSVCYLEDFFVMPEVRGDGAGRLLMETLVVLGKERGWRRIYWHTHENNDRARALYDRLTPRTDYVRYDIEL
jgi:GNAT superfamily N-acetyltransferase